jgi:endo-1,4-beta-xylanase
MSALPSHEEASATPGLNRRTLLITASAAIAACAPMAGRAEQATTGLAGLAAQRGLYFGAAIQTEHLQAERDFHDAVLRECSHLSPEVALNWAAMEPARGQLALTRMDDFATFAADTDKSVHGHLLLWHRAVPDWAAQALREGRDWRLVTRFFASVMPRYGEAIGRWNVVNEPIQVGNRSDGLRQNVFLEVFGPDYIRRALEEARLFAPKAELFINEYSLEYDLPEEAERRRQFLKLIEGLKAAGAPLDGVGLQSHLDLGKGSISEAAVSNFVGELHQLGVTVAVTELDVKEAAYTAPLPVRDAMVGEEIQRYLEVVLAWPCVSGVTTWGLSDRHSWLEITKADYARFPGAWSSGDGPGLNRGLPFDASMRPKPMYSAIEAAIRTAPERTVRGA